MIKLNYLFLSTLFVLTAFSDASLAEQKVRDKHSIVGTFTIYHKQYSSENADNFMVTDNKLCGGMNGFDDLRYEMPITVTNEEGKIIGIGSAGFGVLVDSDCVFTYKIDNIPRSNFYSIEVGRRGKVNYSIEQIIRDNWKVLISIGKRY